MFTKRNVILIFILISVVLISCQEIYSPKNKAYPRVDFPEKNYRLYDSILPFTFECPVYANVLEDNEKGAEKYWSNIVFKSFNAQIHLSYKDISNNLQDFEEDTRKLAYKHTIKADAIDEKIWENDKEKVYGILYDIQVNTASSIQFYLTDSVKHFLRGALYFNTKPNKDSLSPSIQFIRKDIDKMIETLKWKSFK